MSASPAELDPTNHEYLQFLDRPEARQSFRFGENTFDPFHLPEHLRGAIHLTQYGDLLARRDHWRTAARRTVVELMGANGGKGNGVPRASYLERLGLSPEEGAKGPDLKLGHDPTISLTEAKNASLLATYRRGDLGGVVIRDLPSTETKSVLEAIWSKRCVFEPNRSWREFIDHDPNLSLAEPFVQAHLPMPIEGGGSKYAGGGHGIFLYHALKMALHPELRAKRPHGMPMVGAIVNGEDFSSVPDELVVGYASAEQIPLIAVTTEKTEIDKQTGILGVVHEGGETYTTIVETAQAKSAGWLDEFERMPGVVNVNHFLIGYEAMERALRRLCERLGGEEKMWAEIMPAPIVARKKMPDGRAYLQREIPMGAIATRLGRVLSREFPGERALEWVNFDRARRTQVFTPIKSAADYFMLFHSDRFKLDLERWRLADQRAGDFVRFDLDDAYYRDVQMLLDRMEGARIRQLDSLELRGDFDLRGAELIGRIQLVNEGPRQIDLRGQRLAHAEARFDANGRRV